MRRSREDFQEKQINLQSEGEGKREKERGREKKREGGGSEVNKSSFGKLWGQSTSS